MRGLIYWPTQIFHQSDTDICYGNVNKKFSQTDKHKVFSPSILTEPPSKLRNWCRCLSKYRFTIFTYKILCSILALDVANIGINVIIMCRFRGKFSPNFETHCRKTNFDSRFLMNKIILFHLNFTSCKHRHRYYMGVIQILE